MSRRELMLPLGVAAVAAPFAAGAQKAMPVIGFLSAISPGPAAPFAAGIRQGLNEAIRGGILDPATARRCAAPRRGVVAAPDTAGPVRR